MEDYIGDLINIVSYYSVEAENKLPTQEVILLLLVTKLMEINLTLNDIKHELKETRLS